MWICWTIVLIQAIFLGDSHENEDLYQNNSDQSRYSAIGFDYGHMQNEMNCKSSTTNSSNNDKEPDDSLNDVAYICPPNLRLLPGMITPLTEREAAIIEQTAKFVADKGAQLEILIKTKQANNPKFVFLNYDHKLHPFYRHITNLIKTAQYVPGKRHMSHLVESNVDDEQRNGVPLPVAPKIDISSTPYGKLIERFKQSQERKKMEQESTSQNGVTKQSNTKESLESRNGICGDEESSKEPFFDQQRSPSPATVEMTEARYKMYEDLYQQYYPYYYQYYYDMYGTSETVDNLVEMARTYAASSASAWIQSNMPDTTPNRNSKNEDDEDAVIVKMVEYVARNGTEFEQMMLGRNAQRFAFLRPDHANHLKYKTMLDREKDKHRVSCRSSSPPDQIISSIVDSSYGNLSPPHTSPISFKMAAKHGPIVPKHLSDSLSRIEDLDDDFDFTDKLHQSRHGHDSRSATATATATATAKNGRVSRFSPANPKNAVAIANLKNDLQIQRKRKAAEFLASRMLLEKITKPDDTKSSATTSQ